MKLQDSYVFRAARLGAVSLCCVGALYLAFDTARLYEVIPAGQSHRGNQPANRGRELRGVAIPVDRALLPSLPEDWQAHWRDGMLWITHYNPSGTVADCLPFSGLQDYRGWVQAHPDFCDVNVEKLALRLREP